MIIVTGAAGFIGFQTTKKLIENGVSTLGVDRPELFANRPEHSGLKFGTLAPQDILVPSFFENRSIHGIIHLGACTDTTELRVDYLNEVNLHYSQKLWNLAAQFQIPFVYASSAATYGAGEEGYDDAEEKMHLLKPLNPYGESKLKFDLWVLEQAKHPPTWSGFKFFNVYGYGERHKGKMASVVLQGFDQIQKTGMVKLFKSHKAGISDGEQKRDFVYVDDVVDVLLFALQKPIRRGIYNLGTGKARTFLDLANATFSALEKPPSIQFIDTPIEIRDRYQYFTEANMQKIKAIDGFSKKFTALEAGVALTLKQLFQAGGSR